MKQARRLYAEAALNAVHAGERRLFGMIEQNLGALAMVQGEDKDALARFRLSLRGFRDAGDEEGACWVFCNVGRLHMLAGDLDEAERASQEALALAKRLGDLPLTEAVELSRVECCSRAAWWPTRRRVCRHGVAMAEHRGDRAHHAESLRLLALVGRERGELESATRSLDEARAMARESEDALLRPKSSATPANSGCAAASRRRRVSRGSRRSRDSARSARRGRWGTSNGAFRRSRHERMRRVRRCGRSVRGSLRRRCRSRMAPVTLERPLKSLA